LYATISRFAGAAVPAAEAPSPVTAPTVGEIGLNRNAVEPPALEPAPARSLVLSEALKVVDGDLKLLSEVVGIFLAESPRLLTQIEGAIGRADAEVVCRAAHTIKGGLRMFGAQTAYDLASRIEGLGRDGNLAAAGEPFENLKRAMLEMERELSAFVVEPANFAPH
jgi:HPt (histidine-containing phosphotransfer) domain-containing protein